VKYKPDDVLVTLPKVVSSFEFRSSGFLKCYPVFWSAGAGIFRGLGSARRGADEPFMSEIGTLSPIALCGHNSL